MAAFFHQFSKTSDMFSSSELNALNALVANHRQFMLDGGRFAVQVDTWQASCASFLTSMESMACSLGADSASRSYRRVFSVNYQALFPSNDRLYRADVFKASIEQCPTMWVNGDKFEFGATVLTVARKLQMAWAQMDATLEKCNHQGVAASGVSRSEIVGILSAVDVAWANFEQGYIMELMSMKTRPEVGWCVQCRQKQS